jgi:hypothetical protein
MYLQNFKNKIAQSSIGKKKRPCTEQDVRFLEEKLGLSLPTAYKEFLLWGGHNPGRIWEGSDCCFKDLINLQDSALELLEENNFPGSLPEDSFVFFMHQGYQFMFFRIKEGEDPPIYFYKESLQNPLNSFIKLHCSFSECLIKEVEFQEQIRKNKWDK